MDSLQRHRNAWRRSRSARIDYNKFTELARSPQPAASLSEATSGILDRSLRHRELTRPHGFGDELCAALVSDSGTWGGITLMRNAGRAPYTPAHTQLLASLSPYLAEGVQRAIVHTALFASGQEQNDSSVGLLLRADDNTIEMANPAAHAWLDELREGDRPLECLPTVINAVAIQARRAATGDLSVGSIARAPVRTRSGRWALVRGSMLGGSPNARTAVILDAVRSPELAPLIAQAYGLTPRERTVTELVARGHPTSVHLS